MGSYTTQHSDPQLVIEIVAVNPTILQKVMASIPIPPRPTYEVKTVSGRVEQWPIDEGVLVTHPEYTPLLRNYEERQREAQTAQSNRMVSAMFLLGTECEIPSGKWEKTDKFMGLVVPEDPDERRVYYLTTHLNPQDIVGLTTEIMKETGVDEETIQEAEDSFRSAVRNGRRPAGDVVDAPDDSQEAAEQPMAI